MSIKGDAERPCIKCGEVDEIKYMVRLEAFLPPDPDWPDSGRPDYEAWVHEVPCYREYTEIVMKLGLIALEAYMERASREKKR